MSDLYEKAVELARYSFDLTVKNGNLHNQTDVFVEWRNATGQKASFLRTSIIGWTQSYHTSQAQTFLINPRMMQYDRSWPTSPDDYVSHQKCIPPPDPVGHALPNLHAQYKGMANKKLPDTYKYVHLYVCLIDVQY